MKVAVRHEPLALYPDDPPYHPSETYPEYPFSEINRYTSNSIYAMVRQVLYDLGLDRDNFGRDDWNPLGEYVSSGGKVAVKPNWVWDPPYCFEVEESLYATVTHSSMIRALVDFAYIAVGANGRISVLDSPIEDTNWNRLLKWNGFQETAAYLVEEGVPLELIDIRDFESVHLDWKIPLLGREVGFVHRRGLSGDPRGYVSCNLGKHSRFSDSKFTHQYLMRSPQKWTGQEVSRYHDENKHVYSISRTLMESDLVVNLPKLKHHKKAGVTLSMKNLIGATNKKIGLPHFRAGPPPKGDEYPYPKPLLKRIKEKISDFNLFSRFGLTFDRGIKKQAKLPCNRDIPERRDLLGIRVGNWYGSDTLWRTILDLNSVVLCSDQFGKLHETRQRSYLSVMDGIVGGEKKSPLHPTSKRAGLLLASENPLLLDITATRLIGFDPEKIPTLKEATNTPCICPNEESLRNEIIIFNGNEETSLSNLGSFLEEHPEYVTKFVPSIGWLCRIEADACSSYASPSQDS